MIRQGDTALADHCVYDSAGPFPPWSKPGYERMRSIAGDAAVFAGFYTVRFTLNEAVGRSVMYVRDGKMLGGNSAFAHIGSYEENGEDIDIEVKTVRHNPDPNYRAMAGTDDATLVARGRADGKLYRFRGALKEVPGAVFQSVMTPV